jgi:hypothetical protein
MIRIRQLALAAACMVLGCHAQPVGANGSVGNVITREQIATANAANIYDVVARYHADFLNDRGRTSIRTNQTSRAVVFLNDQEYGILETMRNIPPDRIETVRHFSGPEAVVRFGAQYGGGVIQLTSRTE